MERRIDHIGIAVSDLDRALAFWEQALGVVCAGVEVIADRGIKVAVLPLGETRIELIAPHGENSEISRALARRGPGLHHLCLTSEDVDRDLQHLHASGMQVIDEVARPGAEGCLVGFVHPRTSGGVLLELSQRPGIDDGT